MRMTIIPDVREAARLFEEAGASRTERSIINWCQPNRQGVSRLDAFFFDLPAQGAIGGEAFFGLRRTRRHVPARVR
jgi:hypothetical protein